MTNPTAISEDIPAEVLRDTPVALGVEENFGNWQHELIVSGFENGAFISGLYFVIGTAYKGAEDSRNLVALLIAITCLAGAVYEEWAFRHNNQSGTENNQPDI